MAADWLDPNDQVARELMEIKQRLSNFKHRHGGDWQVVCIPRGADLQVVYPEVASPFVRGFAFGCLWTCVLFCIYLAVR